MEYFDAVIIGAGAAGLFCAGVAGQRGRRLLVVDHAAKVAEKIRISGGGRCNFTNRDVSAANYLGDNPAFCRSALARYGSAEFIALVQRERIAFHERDDGQLFCDRSAAEIVQLLLRQCDAGGVVRRQPCRVHAVRAVGAGGFELDLDGGSVAAARVVVATGGLSIPQLGASDFGHRLARQFGLAVVPPRPALVPLTFAAAAWAPFAAGGGVSVPAVVEAGERPRARFRGALLFTHRGLSGPAALQASSYWRDGQPLRIALTGPDDADGNALAAALRQAKALSRRTLGNELATHLPHRLALAWLADAGLDAAQPMPALRDKEMARLAAGLARWAPVPDGTEGFRKAEATAGGVDTRALDSRDLAARAVPGLHFIGEVVDVTGWLGGYNFQWAWSSGYACAQAL